MPRDFGTLRSPSDRRIGRHRPDRVSVAIPVHLIDRLDSLAGRRNITRFALVNEIMGNAADELVPVAS